MDIISGLLIFNLETNIYIGIKGHVFKSGFHGRYEGYSKSSKTNSKKYFIYEIYKIIFLHSFHSIHNTMFPSKNSRT